jgi:hypothetical protein
VIRQVVCCLPAVEEGNSEEGNSEEGNSEEGNSEEGSSAGVLGCWLFCVRRRRAYERHHRSSGVPSDT